MLQPPSGSHAGANPVYCPSVVNLPMKASGKPEGPVNQSAPSGPETISEGWEDWAEGESSNSMIFPRASTRPILPKSSLDSVNHMLPSDPRVMSRGWLLSLGTLNDLKLPTLASDGTVPSGVAVGTAARSQANALSTTADAMSRSLWFILDLR